MRFEIEVRPRSHADRSFRMWISVEAATQQDALEKAKLRFKAENPDKDVADYTFQAVTKG
jgi:hypothetical protein